MKRIISILIVLCLLAELAPAIKAGNSDAFAQVISAGQYHSALINAKGELFLFGLNHQGQLGTGDTENHSTPVKVMDNARFVSCGGYTTAVIDQNNDLYMFGRNKTGMFGIGTYEGSVKPVKVMSDVKTVSVGTLHTAVITNDNRLFVAGSNTYGQLGTGDTKDRAVFTEIANNVMSVSCGYMHTAFITLSHSLYTFGSNTCGQLMYTEGNTALPNPYPKLVSDNAQSVSCGHNLSYYIDDTGRAYGSGENTCHCISAETTFFEYAPKFLCDDVTKVCAGKDIGAVITKSGQLLVSGTNLKGQLGVAAENIMTTLSCTLTNIYTVSFGFEHTLALTTDGRVLSFGYNTYGQLGTSEQLIYSQNGYTLFTDAADSGEIKFDTGHYIDDGELYTWGRGSLGQLGNGLFSSRCTPEKIADNIKSASIGRSHGAAITECGDCLWWGSHYLEHGFAPGYEKRQLPHVIMSDCRDVSCGRNFTGIVTNDDKLYMFGCNTYCQIGGTEEYIGTPKYITNNVKKCICAISYTLILKNDDSLYMCGSDETGLFGTESMMYSAPEKIAEDIDDIYAVSDLLYITKDKTGAYSVHAASAMWIDISEINDTIKNAKQVAVGHSSCAYITQNDELYVWGNNSVGQIGVQGQVNVSSPIRIAENVRSVSCGLFNTSYITQSGRMYVTGLNDNGQAGKLTAGIPTEITDGPDAHAVNVKSHTKAHNSGICIFDEPVYTYADEDEMFAAGRESAEYDKSAYSTLDNYEKSMYELLYRNIPALLAGCMDDLYFIGLPGEKSAASASAVKAHKAFMADHPEYFLISGRSTTVFYGYYDTYKGEYCGYKPFYSLTDDIVQMDALQEEFNSAVSSIISECEGKNAYEIIECIVNRLSEAEPLSDMSDDEDINSTPYSVLCYKGGVKPDYRAYSSALKILLDRLHFENYIVFGSKDGNANYNWNTVRMNDGRWYAIDLYTAFLSGDSSYILAGESIMNDMSYTNSLGLSIAYPILSESEYTPCDTPMYDCEKPEMTFAEYLPPVEHQSCTNIPDKSHVYMLCAEENGVLYALTQNVVRYYGSMRKGLEARPSESADISAFWYAENTDKGLVIQNAKSGEYLTFDNTPQLTSEKSYLQYDVITGKLHNNTQSMRLWSTGHNDAAFTLMHDAEAYYIYTGICFHSIGQKGDCNMDGTVNSADAVAALKHSAEMIQLTDEQKALADCNHDGNVNTGDAVMILKFSAGMMTEI